MAFKLSNTLQTLSWIEFCFILWNPTLKTVIFQDKIPFLPAFLDPPLNLCGTTKMPLFPVQHNYNGSGLKGTASYLNNVESYCFSVIIVVKLKPHCWGDLELQVFLLFLGHPVSPHPNSSLSITIKKTDWQVFFHFMQFYHHHFHVSQTTNHALHHMHILIVLKVSCISSLNPILSILAWVTVTLSHEQCVRWLDSPLWGLWSTS